MKKLNIILILLGILFWSLFFSITAKAQIHLGAGFVDISDRMDGNAPYNWNVGYIQPVGDFGIGFNYRATKTLGELFRSWEFRLNHRIIDENYKMVLGTGWAFNQEEKDSYPVLHWRNSIRISRHAHLALDFDNSFRLGERSRTETYIGFALIGDYDFIKDMFSGRPRQ